MSSEPRPGPGRPARAAAVQPAAAAPSSKTAREQLDALAAIRASNGGFLVPPPPGMNDAKVLHPNGSSISTLPQHNAELKAVCAWFDAIAKAGGAPGDLQQAWHAWRPESLPSPKHVVRSQFEAQLAVATSNDMALRKQADAEARPARNLAVARAARRPALERVNKARTELASAEAALEKTDISIAIAERSMPDQETAA